jgi:hypothetical protein
MALLKLAILAGCIVIAMTDTVGVLWVSLRAKSQRNNVKSVIVLREEILFAEPRSHNEKLVCCGPKW